MNLEGGDEVGKVALVPILEQVSEPGSTSLTSGQQSDWTTSKSRKRKGGSPRTLVAGRKTPTSLSSPIELSHQIIQDEGTNNTLLDTLQESHVSRHRSSSNPESFTAVNSQKQHHHKKEGESRSAKTKHELREKSDKYQTGPTSPAPRCRVEKETKSVVQAKEERAWEEKQWLTAMEEGIVVASEEDKAALSKLEKQLALGVYASEAAPTKATNINIDLAFDCKALQRDLTRRESRSFVDVSAMGF